LAAGPEVELVNLGLVDTPQGAEAAGHAVRQADIDLLFRYYVTTYQCVGEKCFIFDAEVVVQRLD
jgi:hypothetical protein